MMTSKVFKIDDIDPLKELQKAFCLLKLVGKLFVCERSEIRRLRHGGLSNRNFNMYSKVDGQLLLERHLTNLPCNSDLRGVTKQFYLSPNTLVLDKITFTPLKTPETTLNFWVAPRIEPNPGNCTTIVNFLKYVLCDGNKELFDYLIQFLAHMWQRPAEKPGICIVLLGGQGTGKGTFFKLMQRIWHKTTLQVASIDHIVGNFNGAMEQNYIVVMDEALFSGDRRSMDRLKSMITEPTISIEQKYQPRRETDSIHRFFASSNHEHFGTIDKDDRRFVFLRISDDKAGEHNYFNRLHMAIDDKDQLSAFVQLLEDTDLSGYNFRNKPSTPELTRQKLKSLQGFERYWYEILYTGEHVGNLSGHCTDAWNDGYFVATQTIISSFKMHSETTQRFKTIQAEEVANAIKRLCPSAESLRKSEGTQQRRGYQFPSLATARDEFQVAIQGVVDWPA